MCVCVCVCDWEFHPQNGRCLHNFPCFVFSYVCQSVQPIETHARVICLEPCRVNWPPIPSTWNLTSKGGESLSLQQSCKWTGGFLDYLPFGEAPYPAQGLCKQCSWRARIEAYAYDGCGQDNYLLLRQANITHHIGATAEVIASPKSPARR